MAGRSVLNSESSRYELLEDAIAKTTTKITEKLKLSLWSECHPDIYQKKEKELIRLHESMVKKIRVLIRESLDGLIKEDLKLREKLDLLDSLERDQEKYQKDGPAWRPSGNPEIDTINEDFNYLESHKRKLQELLAERKEEVRNLQAKVSEKREEIATLMENIEGNFKATENICEHLQQIKLTD